MKRADGSSSETTRLSASSGRWTAKGKMMIQPTFDLLKKRWIPVIRDDGVGKPDEVPLTQVLAEAHALREIRDPLPIVEFGLYRLLTALVMDIFEPQNTFDLADLLDLGAF